MNMFEIAHSLNRQFGPEQWCIYRGKHLMTFVDNHDVSRLATILTNKEHLPLAYGLLSECREFPASIMEVNGEKKARKLRTMIMRSGPCFEEPKPNGLTAFIKALISLRRESDALCNGSYRNVVLHKPSACL